MPAANKCGNQLLIASSFDEARVSSLREIATQEGVDNSYVSRMMNLTVLAPDIVEAILDDALPDHLILFDIAVNPLTLWDDQIKSKYFYANT